VASTHLIQLAWTHPVTGEDHAESLPLPATIGRAVENHIVLTSEVVSRKHATIAVEDGTVTLTDTSANGTAVNGARQRHTSLTPGDVIQIGPFALAVRTIVAPERPVAERVTLTWRDKAGDHRETFSLPLTIGRGAGSGLLLPDQAMSRTHATIAATAGQIIVTDSSRNGTFVNEQRVQRAVLHDGDRVRVGGTMLAVALALAPMPAHTPARADATIAFDEQITRMIEVHGPAGGAATMLQPPGTPMSDAEARTIIPETETEPLPLRTLPPPVFERPVVPMAALERTGLPLYTTTYALLGGGLGSFIMADFLRIHGVPASAIISLGISPKPYERYARLCRNSQIPLYERLRSNSESTPDNIWGTPGYAAREAWESFRHGQWGDAGRVLWQVFGEPTVAQTYTPRSGDVFRGIDNEARRIDWESMFRFGRVRAIRRTDDGRYAVAYSQSDDQQQMHAILLASHVHLATGYPALQFLPDLQEYRERTGDFARVVNAYEPHDHVYEHLEQYGGIVLLRGRGIVASRLIQRLYEARAKNPNIHILHLMRTPKPEGQKFRRAQRTSIHHVEIQPFNWPKGAWGGEQRLFMERASEDERLSLLSDWGGTTTAQRRDWVQIVDEGERDSWYKITFGDVTQVDRAADGRVVTRIHSKDFTHGTTELVADYIIDATGLDAKVNRNALLQDLVEHGGAAVNKLGRLAVTNAMEVPGLRNGTGRFYAAGSMTLGGPLAGADSFLGLAAAAQLTVEDLIRLRTPGIRRLGPVRSFRQWLKWMRGVKP
jgi:pSer/pThr/pTyr-binding forkhead associated (FHA) protein